MRAPISEFPSNMVILTNKEFKQIDYKSNRNCRKTGFEYSTVLYYGLDICTALYTFYISATLEKKKAFDSQYLS